MEILTIFIIIVTKKSIFIKIVMKFVKIFRQKILPFSKPRYPIDFGQNNSVKNFISIRSVNPSSRQNSIKSILMNYQFIKKSVCFNFDKLLVYQNTSVKKF